MTSPRIGIVDTLIGFPADPNQVYASVRRSLRDRESRDEFAMPAAYMFHDVPAEQAEHTDDPLLVTLTEMDRFGIEVGLVSLTAHQDVVERALHEHPNRFVASWTCDPNEGTEGLRKLVRAHEQWGVGAAAFFPHGVTPQVAIDAPQAYPFYAKCVELGIPMFVTTGIAGPRVPSTAQHVERIDQVMYDFPELVLVMRHGAEPWVDLAVKLMLKWPGLHYSTSGFAPRRYPSAIIDYANTRGADKIMYGGYFPMGLSLERIMGEMQDLQLRDAVWPKFLRDNAMRVLGLESR